MKTIGLWVYPGREADPCQLAQVLSAFRQKGFVLYTLPFMREVLCDVPVLPMEVFYRLVDCVVALGGDGTVLGAARDSAPYGSEVLGVNLGHKGFLTCANPQNVDAVLDQLLSGSYQVEDRLMLEAQVKGRKDTLSYALNDVLLCSSEPMTMIHTQAFADGVSVGEFDSDGLLLSTPTGSTGYNLSAGGPVIGPGAQVLLLTPLHAHSMRSVPLVLPMESEVVMTFMSHGKGLLIADGRDMAVLDSGEAICVHSAPFRAKLIQTNPGQFYELLYAKLK